MDKRIEIVSVNDMTDVALVYSASEERNELMKLASVSGDGKPITIVNPEPLMTFDTLKKCINEDANIKCVYVWTLSRLSRSIEELTKIADYLKSKSIQLVVKTPSIQLLNDDGTISVSGDLAFSLLQEFAKTDLSKLKH
jgi:hypothetical protein